jgi:hypothetical protein
VKNDLVKSGGFDSMLGKVKKKIKYDGFTMIDRNAVMDDIDLDYNEKLLLIVICSFRHSTKQIKIEAPQELLIKLMGCKIKTLRKIRASLKKKGKIEFRYDNYRLLFKTDAKSYTKAFYAVLYNAELTPKEKLALVAMEHFIRQKEIRSFNKSIASITQVMGYKKSSVLVTRNILKQLKKKAYISFEECKGGISKGIGITYRFILPDYSKNEFIDITDTIEAKNEAVKSFKKHQKKISSTVKDEYSYFNKTKKQHERIISSREWTGEISIEDKATIDEWGF